MIKLEHLKKSYDHFYLDCSLTVKPGCVTGLIGQNGAGKSTTFKAILGLISTDGGSAQVLGKEPGELKPKDREQIGVVLSDSGFSGYFTVKDVAVVMEHLYHHFDKAYFLEQCRRFQLPDNKKIKEFSTGMKAKLKVLAAISHGASLLLLDEPTAGLDVVVRDQVLDMLRDFMEKGENNSILISSHISTDLESICDDLYMIHEGKIIFHEETDVLLDNYALLKVSPEQMKHLDREHLLRIRREGYGYSCLTNQKRYYMENCPQITVERGNIDELITMMVKGEAL